MASYVSSERAFSSTGITISKHCNRLKPDVIKALQFLKCIYHCDLLFHENPCVETEMEKLKNESPELAEVNTCNPNEEEWDNMVEDF